MRFASDMADLLIARYGHNCSGVPVHSVLVKQLQSAPPWTTAETAWKSLESGSDVVAVAQAVLPECGSIVRLAVVDGIRKIGLPHAGRRRALLNEALVISERFARGEADESARFDVWCRACSSGGIESEIAQHVSSRRDMWAAVSLCEHFIERLFGRDAATQAERRFANIARRRIKWHGAKFTGETGLEEVQP